MFIVRQEESKDHDAVFAVVSAAFKTPAEAELVNRLRSVPRVISLVAESNEKVIGHIMFSPVDLLDERENQVDIKIAGLAPVAVLPDKQQGGVGKALINAGLNACRKAGFVASVLLGHPDYYPKFGFQPAYSTYGIKSTYDVPDPVFMALELTLDALKGRSGTIHYHQTFNGI